MPLTEIQARNSKPRERAYKLADGEGLFLLVQPNGSKLWRMKYRFGGKEKLLSFGAYPELGIAAARDKRTAAKALLVYGKDPMKSKGEVISQEGATSGSNLERARPPRELYRQGLRISPACRQPSLPWVPSTSFPMKKSTTPSA